MDKGSTTQTSGGTTSLNQTVETQFPFATIQDVEKEVTKAESKFPPFHSAHEGISIIREEFEELWDHVKVDTGYSHEAYTEATQLAAMAVRYMRMVMNRRVAGRTGEKGTR